MSETYSCSRIPGSVKIERILEVCIDSLESGINAIHGGAHELELCSSLIMGGLTPSPGLVDEVIRVVNSIKNNHEDCTDHNTQYIPKLNIMIRCRGGADFCYTKTEMQTMLADIRIFKEMSVNRFVFGALTENQEIDSKNCSLIIAEASPIPVTFHRAFDLCRDPYEAMDKIIQLGFNRVLTSGQRISAVDNDALKLIKELINKFGNDIEIMPGSGVNIVNVTKLIEIGSKIVHSSCKVEKIAFKVTNDLGMGCTMFVADKNIVKSMVQTINK